MICLVKNFLFGDLCKCLFFVPEIEFCGYLLGKGVRKPAPGKLMAIEKWESPTTVTRLRAFLGFTNHYSVIMEGYAKIVSPLMDFWQVNKKEGKKGSQKRVLWGPEQQTAFDSIKPRLCGNLLLHPVNPDKPFVLCTDASGYDVGATLEQMVDEVRMPTPEDVQQNKTVPVHFCREN